MPKNIEFLFDFVSPTSFLAHKRLDRIAERTGATVRYIPVFLGGVMKATGNSPPFMVPAKGVYMRRDLERFAARDDVPLVMNPFFPINTMPLLRIALALEGGNDFRPYVDIVFDALWLEGVNLGDMAIVADVLAKNGFNAETLLAQAEAPDAKERLRQNTDYALQKGMFGAPSFLVDGELFFGQDRTDWVEKLAAS